MNNNVKINPEAETTDREFELFQLLKPYIARSLTLNHELNNHLAGIIGYSDLFLADAKNLTNDQRDQLDKIIACAEKINEVLIDFSVSKIELNKTVDLKVALKQFLKDESPLD